MKIIFFINSSNNLELKIPKTYSQIGVLLEELNSTKHIDAVLLAINKCKANKEKWDEAYEVSSLYISEKTIVTTDYLEKNYTEMEVDRFQMILEELKMFINRTNKMTLKSKRNYKKTIEI